MTFNPNIPLPTDFISDSQADIRNNFTSINATFSRNHIPFSTVTNNGKHTFIEMPVISTIPTPVPGLISGEGTIYTKTISAVSEIFYTPDSSGNQYQLTTTIPAAFAKFATNTAYSTGLTGGWTFLPGGLLLQYGKNTGAGAVGTIVFPIAFSDVPYSLTLTSTRNAASSVGINAVTASQFTYITSSASVTSVNFIAIGPR